MPPGAGRGRPPRQPNRDKTTRRTSREMSNKSEIRSSARSHSEQPRTAQLYALRHNHEMSLIIIDDSFLVRAVSTNFLAKSHILSTFLLVLKTARAHR